MIGSESGMQVRVCVVLDGRGRDGTMMVVGSWWRREGVGGGMRRRVVAYRAVYRREG